MKASFGRHLSVTVCIRTIVKVKFLTLVLGVLLAFVYEHLLCCLV